MEEKFNGVPSLTLPHDPLYSIVVACYNSTCIEPLLKSIADQEMKDDIEVIISDDCSSDLSYLDIVEKYEDQICIKKVRTAYNFAPGNTRERGVAFATGEWILFADHDDYYEPRIFSDMKQIIEENNLDFYIVTDFRSITEEGQEIEIIRRATNWNHGKFYNRKNLWEKYNIHFKRDLLTHEDICISSQLDLALFDRYGSNSTFTYVPKVSYNWVYNKNSISRQKYKGKNFLEVFYSDYIESTFGVYKEYINKRDRVLRSPEEGIFFESLMVSSMLFNYFYLQGFKCCSKEYIKDNEDIARDCLVYLKELFGITNEDIYQIVKQNPILYHEVYLSAIRATGPYVPENSFRQWLDTLHKDIFLVQKKKTMKDYMGEE